MIRASVYIASIPALAAVLAIVATAITTQWQREQGPVSHECTAVKWAVDETPVPIPGAVGRKPFGQQRSYSSLVCHSCSAKFSGT
jgi:hypothetical protein